MGQEMHNTGSESWKIEPSYLIVIRFLLLLHAGRLLEGFCCVQLSPDVLRRICTSPLVGDLVVALKLAAFVQSFCC